MDAKQIKKMGRKLEKFLGEFDDCFGRSGPREHLRTYVSGQLSDLPRKSIEPIALAAKIPPRTLQYFLSSMQWDQQRLPKLRKLRKLGIKISQLKSCVPREV